MKFSMTAPLVVLLCCYVALDATKSAAQSQSFHVQGTVNDVDGAVIPGANVSFHSDQETKQVSTNANGIYEADLDLGVYTMTVLSPHFHAFYRPAFRITSPTRVTVDATLHVAGSCDVVGSNSSGTPPTAAELDEGARLFCRREESFPVPALDGIPFEVYVHYGNRKADKNIFTYTSQKSLAPQIFVAYNLFSLLADNVVYDASHQTLEASGHVVVVKEAAETDRADSMSFRFSNGQAIPLR